MRHDPASAAVVVMLHGLKMYGMAQAVGDLNRLAKHGSRASSRHCIAIERCFVRNESA